MKILQLLIFLWVPGFVFSCEKSGPADDPESKEKKGRTYFINSQEDFEKWSNFEFPAGSKVLFAAGKTFKGQFKLRGSGTDTSPNFAGAYDNKTGNPITAWTDNKPVIHGEGKVSSTFELSDGGFLEINNLEVTNSNGTKSDQGKLLGIKVTATDAGLIRDLTVKNCFVHDVKIRTCFLQFATEDIT
jgi:hypothetical protein